MRVSPITRRRKCEVNLQDLLLHKDESHRGPPAKWPAILGFILLVCCLVMTLIHYTTRLK